MKPIAGNVYSFSAVIRRPQISPRCYGQRLQCRNKSTPTHNEPGSNSPPSKPFLSNTHPDTKSNDVTENETENENKNKNKNKTSLSPHTPGPAPTSAGASIPSVPEQTPASTSLSLRQLIKRSAIGRAANWYGREQDKRPYWTQIWSTLVIYLCGDISAQLILSGNDDSPTTVAAEGEDGEVGEDGGGGKGRIQGIWERYDPARTLRHLTVGGVACIPVYKWCVYTIYIYPPAIISRHKTSRIDSLFQVHVPPQQLQLRLQNPLHNHQSRHLPSLLYPDL